MSLTVEVRLNRPGFALEAAFDSEGPVTAVFGASGSGKTSLVNVIAGLLTPRHGRVLLNGQPLLDTGRRLNVPPHRRRIGYVFQDARLFPHLSVSANLAYGAWFAPRAERYASRPQILHLLGIEPLLERRPHELSGGEKQRVAIGRALLASPRLLLMDEPLASLDGPRKAEIMPYLERLRDEIRIPIVYVSHSVDEVMRLASFIAVLDQGRLSAFGPAAAIAQRLDLVPREEQDEAGVILDMRVDAFDSSSGLTALSSPAGRFFVPGRLATAAASARMRIRARDVMLALDEPRNISALNIVAGRVTDIRPAGGHAVHVRLDCAGAAIIARITRHSANQLGLAPGCAAYGIIKAVSVSGPSSEEPR